MPYEDLVSTEIGSAIEIDIVIVAIMGIDDCAFSSSALASSRSFLLSASLLQRTAKFSEGERLTQRESKRSIEHFAAIFCYRFFSLGQCPRGIGG
jgi:hypothetical protein